MFALDRCKRWLSKHRVVCRCIGFSRQGLRRSLSLAGGGGSGDLAKARACSSCAPVHAGPCSAGGAGSLDKGWGRCGDGAAWLSPLFLGPSLLLLMPDGLCKAPWDGTEPRQGAAPVPTQPLSISFPSPSTGPSGLQDQPLIFKDVKPLDTCKAIANGLCRPERM